MKKYVFWDKKAHKSVHIPVTDAKENKNVSHINRGSNLTPILDGDYII